MPKTNTSKQVKDYRVPQTICQYFKERKADGVKMFAEFEENLLSGKVNINDEKITSVASIILDIRREEELANRDDHRKIGCFEVSAAAMAIIKENKLTMRKYIDRCLAYYFTPSSNKRFSPAREIPLSHPFSIPQTPAQIKTNQEAFSKLIKAIPLNRLKPKLKDYFSYGTLYNIKQGTRPLSDEEVQIIKNAILEIENEALDFT